MMAAMRRKQRGFTLIELMITIGIVGILAAIAIPNLMHSMMKSKGVEKDLALDGIVKHVRIYYATRGSLPPSAGLILPAVSACASPTGKTPQTLQSVWEADPGWRALGFHSGEAGYYQYYWSVMSPNFGFAEAFGDLDCDGVLSIHIINVQIVNGNVFQTTGFDITD